MNHNDDTHGKASRAMMETVKGPIPVIDDQARFWNLRFDVHIDPESATTYLIAQPLTSDRRAVPEGQETLAIVPPGESNVKLWYLRSALDGYYGTDYVFEILAGNTPNTHTLRVSHPLLVFGDGKVGDSFDVDGLELRQIVRIQQLFEQKRLVAVAPERHLLAERGTPKPREDWTWRMHNPQDPGFIAKKIGDHLPTTEAQKTDHESLFMAGNHGFHLPKPENQKIIFNFHDDKVVTLFYDGRVELNEAYAGKMDEVTAIFWQAVRVSIAAYWPFRGYHEGDGTVVNTKALLKLFTELYYRNELDDDQIKEVLFKTESNDDFELIQLTLEKEHLDQQIRDLKQSMALPSFAKRSRQTQHLIGLQLGSMAQTRDFINERIRTYGEGNHET